MLWGVITSYWLTFLWSLAPFFELRASIPLGYFEYGLSIFESVGVSVIGGILVAFMLLWLLPVLVPFCEKHIPVFHRIIVWVFARTRGRHSKRLELAGEVFLVLLVATPLPGSGAYTGAVLAYLFGMKKPLALGLISLGVVLSGFLVGGMTMGVDLAINN